MRRSQLGPSEMVEAFSSQGRVDSLSPNIWSLLAIAVTVAMVCPTFAVAEEKTQSVQGPAQSGESDQDLKERVKSLEQTVEDLKKERGSPKVGESNVKREEGYQGPTAGTSAEVPLHERMRGMLRQDNQRATTIRRSVSSRSRSATT